MSTEYEPGTVVKVRFNGEEVRAMRTGLKSNPGWEISRPDGQAWVADKNTTEGLTVVRPLVVLDLPDGASGGWEVLVDALRRAKAATALDMVFGGLIEQIQAQTKPPKPDEPTGLGAVVEDTRGVLWVRKGNTEHGEDWARQVGNAWTGGGWDRIDAVRVLSDGWSA